MLQTFLTGGKLWSVLLLAALTTILASALPWMCAHPYAISWDEAEYFNAILKDEKCLHERGLRALGWELRYEDRVRPPAFRILAVPSYVVFGLSPLSMRLTSLAFHWVGLAFVYLTVRRLANSSCAVLAVLILCLSPDVLFASILFYTEFPLFLATAATFYYVVAGIQETPCRTRDWVGLGVALGLGLLAKVNFVLVAFPVLVLVLAARQIRWLTGPPPCFVIKAAALGCLLAAPWWWTNWQIAWDYAQYSRNFVSGSLGPPSLDTYAAWSYSVMLSLLGPGSFLVIAMVLLAATRSDMRLEPAERTVLLACLCGALPLVLIQLSGTNHLLRHITPSLVPLAILIGLLAYKSGWSTSVLSRAVCAAAFLVQLIMIALPVISPDPDAHDSGLMNGRYPWRVLMHLDQWDWTPLRRLSESHGLDEPFIAYLGGERNLNPAHMRYVWMLDGKEKTQVNWLWRHEHGPIDWEKVMKEAGRSDIVLTAPRLEGDAEDNEHNQEFAQRLAQDRRFEGPIRLWMGNSEPVEVDVFVKKRPQP